MILNSLTSQNYRVEGEPVVNSHLLEYRNTAYAILCPIVMTVVTTMLTVIMAENLWHNGGHAHDVEIDAVVIIVGGMALAVSGVSIYSSITYFKASPYCCCNSAAIYPENPDIVAYVVGLDLAGEVA